MADKEKHFILIEGKLVEVEKKVYVDYYRMNRRERYLEERDKDNGVFSYDALDGDGRKGEELFPDPKIESVEALALSQELMRQLHKPYTMHRLTGHRRCFCMQTAFSLCADMGQPCGMA